MIRKVLFLSGNLNVYGVSHYMRTLGRELRKNGIEVAVAAVGIGGTYDKAWYEREGIHVYPLQGNFTGRRGLFNLSGIRGIRDVIRSLDNVVEEFRPDIIHANGGQTALVARLRNLLSRRSVPLISCIHGDAVKGTTEVKKFRIIKIMRIFGRLLRDPYGKFVIAISDEMREFLRDTLGVPEARIRHIIYGIDGFYPPSTEEKLAARASLGLPNDAWVASLVGQYEYRKGQDVLIDAMGLLKRRGVPLVVVCAGEHHNEKTYKEGLLEQAGRLGVLESLVLLGHRESREVFHASDFVVLPSRLEGFGLVIAEGMMCGAIPIRTPAAGARETVQDGKTGFIIPFDDPAALADRIETLIRSSELRKAMRSNAIAYAREHFTAARMAAETLRVYEEALAEDLKQ